MSGYGCGRQGRRGPARIGLVLAFSLLLGPAAAGRSLAGERSLPEPPPTPRRPAEGIEVPAGDRLRLVLRDAPPDAVLVLAPGSHQGPVMLDKPVTIWGPREAVIRTAGEGTTVTVAASGVRLRGFTVDGSGDRFEETDAAVQVAADDVAVEGVRVTRALFGIVVDRARRVRLVGNEIIGSGAEDYGLRGDSIRLWEVRESLIARNRITGARDVVIWYSPDNRIEYNLVEDGRYGTHFMYSGGNQVRDNVYLRNLVGVFIMYCDDIEIVDNLMAAAVPGEGMGLGLKEAGNVRVTGNRFLCNPTGIYVDTSPIQIHHENAFTDNSIEFCDTGIMFHSSEKRNSFIDNDFAGCAYAVRVDGHGDATAVRWRGNYFDDYAGFDLDDDGYGDVPYESRSLANQLTSTRESFRFFRGTPALGLLEVVSRALPILTPKVLFTDPGPRMRPNRRGGNHAP